MTAFFFSDLEGERLSWEPESRTLTVRGEEHEPRALFIQAFQPDCHRCEDLARSLDDLMDAEGSGLSAVGIAYRGDEEAARAFLARTGVSYPVAVATGSEWARAWGRGDPLYLVDASGAVAYAQTGFRDDDVELWRDAVRDILAGQPVRAPCPKREALLAGDVLPEIALPDLLTGERLSLKTEGGVLTLQKGEEPPYSYVASVGFFSRY